MEEAGSASSGATSTSDYEVLSQHLWDLQLEVNTLRAQLLLLQEQVQELQASHRQSAVRLTWIEQGCVRLASFIMSHDSVIDDADIDRLLLHARTSGIVDTLPRLPWDSADPAPEEVGEQAAQCLIAEGLFEAVNFAHHVMGMPFCKEILEDRRLQGRAKRLEGERAEVKQQDPLTVECVAKLEKLVASNSLCDADTYVLGGIVFCLKSRSRWSDLRNLMCIWVDFESDDQQSGFVEARTRDHKTSNTVKTKRRAMPLVAPFPRVTDANWVKAWWNAGLRLGVQWDAEPFGPLVRAPDAEGQLCKRRCTSSEAGVMLCNALDLDGDQRRTSHVLKGTTLAWVGKRGFGERDSLLLGGAFGLGAQLGHEPVDVGHQTEVPGELEHYYANNLPPDLPDSSRPSELGRDDGSWDHVEQPMPDAGEQGLESGSEALFPELFGDSARDTQCERAGLTAPWVTALKESGITTLGKLSYAVTLPGNQPSSDDMDAFILTLRPGARITLGDSSALKQLIFESQTMTVAELRSSMQATDEVPRKLPASERSMRIDAQKRRLSGLPLEGPLAVAHCVYDRLATMRENDELKYLAPNECITRDEELCCEKLPKALHLDASKTGLVLKDEEATAAISLDSDLSLYQAMMRRALAMDLVGLASYACVQKWNERLFRIMSQDPPPEFQRVSRAQVLRADRQCFLELARVCNGNLKPGPDGSLPLDKEFERLEFNTTVMYFLLPVKGRGRGGGKADKDGKGRKRTKTTNDGESPNKKAKITRDPIPEVLKGMHSRTPDNKPICFNFNLGKCKGTCTGDVIACAVPECQGSSVHLAKPVKACQLVWLSPNGVTQLFCDWQRVLSSFRGDIQCEVARCIYIFAQLIKHCADTDTMWTIEAPSRSPFWKTSLGLEVSSSAVEVDLSRYAPGARGRIKFASSCPRVLSAISPPVVQPPLVKASLEAAMGRMYRALALVMLEHLDVDASSLPPLFAAQVGTGKQPRKPLLAPVPEFKYFVRVTLSAVPILDNKRRLLQPLRVHDVVVPAGAKLLPPLYFTAAESVKGVCLPVSGDKSSETLLAAGSRAAAMTVTSEAEALAADLCDTPTQAQLLQVFDMLPAETPARGVKDAREKAWSAGAYSQGTLCGLRKNTKLFPNAVRLAVRLLRSRFPHATFATVAIYSNVCTPMHRDANNLDGSSNYVMALADFAKGGIWVQDDEGQHVRATPLGKATGRVLQVCDNPHCFHCTLPWEGSRVVLIGFTPNRVGSLKKDDVRVLRDLGFPLPGHPTPVSCATTTCPPDHQTESGETDPVAMPVQPTLVTCSAATCPPDQPCKSGDTEPVAGPVQQTHHATFGVPFDESEFVRAAVRAGHPSSSLSSLPDHLESCVDMLAKAPPHAVVDKRRRWLDKWTTRACEIERDPDPSWDIDDPHMKRVLCKKRLQLLDEIIAAEGYDDVNLARDIWSGFDLVGTSPVSNVLPGKVTPASLHPDDLCAAAPRANEALKVSLGSSGDREKDILLWEKTMKEVDSGWLLGPFEWDSLPQEHVVSHRFPLLQSGKLRPIDDYSRSGVNSCVTTLEQPTVDTADVAAAMFVRLCTKLRDSKKPSWIKGRAFDLTAAYRQLCVALSSRRFAVIAVYDPHKQKTMLFTQVCLPFGSRASVNGFIRCSRCIQWLANRCLLVPTTSYYDDFIVASPDCLADNTGKCLRWDRFDLENTGDCVVTVDNTEKRKGDIRALVTRILDEGVLPYKEGLELRGKLSFANSQVMGKAGHYALKHISSHVHAWPFVPKLSDPAREALSFLLDRVLHGSPRRITRSLGQPWFVFTDASFEPDFTGGLGGVLISPLGSVVSWFGLPLSESDIRPLTPVDAITGIGELETVAVVVAFMLWSQHLASSDGIP
ncbi:ubiad1 [Symbiodinium sp. CCMP2592]|nr:ubiad1 [Symbiodinium sp. CCMP2592]